jgi:hypothetical protein
VVVEETVVDLGDAKGKGSNVSDMSVVPAWDSSLWVYPNVATTIFAGQGEAEFKAFKCTGVWV